MMMLNLSEEYSRWDDLLSEDCAGRTIKKEMRKGEYTVEGGIPDYAGSDAAE